MDSDSGLTGEFTFVEEQTKFEPKFGPSLLLLHCLLTIRRALVLEGEHLEEGSGVGQLTRGYSRIEQDRTYQGRTGQIRAGQDRAAYLGDLPDPLGPPLPEQHPGATLHKLRVLDEP